jgi:hypothetical protein
MVNGPLVLFFAAPVRPTSFGLPDYRRKNKGLGESFLPCPSRSHTIGNMPTGESLKFPGGFAENAVEFRKRSFAQSCQSFPNERGRAARNVRPA